MQVGTLLTRLAFQLPVGTLLITIISERFELLICIGLHVAPQALAVSFTVNPSGTCIGRGLRPVRSELTFRDLLTSLPSRCRGSGGHRASPGQWEQRRGNPSAGRLVIGRNEVRTLRMEPTRQGAPWTKCRVRTSRPDWRASALWACADRRAPARSRQSMATKTIRHARKA